MSMIPSRSSAMKDARLAAGARTTRFGMFQQSLQYRDFRARSDAGSPEAADASAPEPTTQDGETFQFQAEVGRVMDIIINSLYSNRDVFLREMISNAADACDKKRFLRVQDGADSSEKLGIRVIPNKEARTLIVEDTGIGMDREELQRNLGRIAQSGTAKFMEEFKDSSDAQQNLIGKFGVGFYSAFLVADKVEVVTKKYGGGPQYRWSSEASSMDKFKIQDDNTPFECTSGTRIILTLKDDCDDYLDDFKIKELLRKYSEFVNFPIDVWSSKTSYEQVPDEAASNNTQPGEPPKTKTVAKTTEEFETLNEQRPIWLRNPREVNKTDYTEFYKSTFRAFDEPLTSAHFAVEGQVEFKSLLFVPGSVPFELMNNMFDNSARGIRLYVKRVFINDKFEDLMPRWLLFIRGVVDSDDLPLNVGREILQKSNILRLIRRRLVRRSIDMFKELAQDETKYKRFWDMFGKYLKIGIIEDDMNNKEELAKLCRFWSSKSGNQLTTLEKYVSNMKEGQKSIYYITGESKEVAAKSPTLEKLKKAGYEVLYLTDPVDEFVFQSLRTFDDKEIMDASKENVDVGTTDEEKKQVEEVKKELEPLTTWLKSLLADNVEAVQVSNRLEESPAVLVQGQFGMSPTMERFMRAQASTTGRDFSMRMKPTLEINPRHPIVDSLRSKFVQDKHNKETQNFAKLLYDVAAMAGGYNIEDPNALAVRIMGLMNDGDVFEQTGEDVESSGKADSSSQGGKGPDDGSIDVVDAEVVS
eukprot:CAMPEP_0114506326 /NCGR_PEP_ID=MMETSP0109-20121206/11369_1 /TAXON_ID=29199 /ORGANISM="Chlorarachnion reptans, Strain CCCM449" /LENGTH=755 /DNA_ID=CAMNT_0001684909 /DNA_START=275 /DNA_END=2542 /DNA_ORIENTATION=+